MSLKSIRKLGDPILREIAMPVLRNEIPLLIPQIEMMWDTIAEFRQATGRGRAIAAPQVGLLKRIICINADTRQALINPELTFIGDSMMEIWDDCMSFPDLLVKVLRYRDIRVSFFDTEWKRIEWTLTGDMAELLQHEYDHLNGILATDRAIDKFSFRWIGDEMSPWKT